MKEGRELDVLVAEQVLGHTIIGQRKGTLKERTRAGQVRPLRAYSTDIAAAWELVRLLGIALLPISDGKWFGLIGKERAWQSPADFLTYLQKADYVSAGAAVADTAPMTICLAALRAVQKRDVEESVPASTAQQLH